MSESKKLDSIEDLLKRLLTALTSPSQSSADAPPWERIAKTLDEMRTGQKQYIETMQDCAKAFRSVERRMDGLEKRFDTVIDELQKH